MSTIPYEAMAENSIVELSRDVGGTSEVGLLPRLASTLLVKDTVEQSTGT
jgi:hypothetical protein